MIDLNGLKNASAELFKRTGIFIEVRDSNSAVIYRSNEKQNMTFHIVPPFLLQYEL